MALRLSENKVGGNYTGTRRSNNNDFINCNSIVAVTIARYSASVEERATVSCFVELQEIGLTPRKIRKAPVEVRSSRLVAQSASEKLCNVKGVFARIRTPRVLVSLR